jgi:aminoglycoside/choline kinase family phosphotransferase
VQGTMTPSDRDAERLRWLDTTLAARGEQRRSAPAPLTADASFRRFERISTDAGSRILMDAPPATERNAEFIAISGWLQAAGLLAPVVLAADTTSGFLLVTDLGDETLARALEQGDRASRGELYCQVIDTLVRFQRASLDLPPPFATYDRERLALENGLFRTWFVEGLLGIEAPGNLLEDALELLTRVHLAAPRIGVHLDWHCRNLLLCPRAGRVDIGIVDFQDARIGPLPYDLVSLLRDCYQRFAPAEVEAWLQHDLRAARAAELPGIGDATAFRRDFDLIGIQRHLKAIGIFARLHLRDGRDHALGDIERVLEHLADVLAAHPQFAALGHGLAAEVRPAHAAWQQARGRRQR